MSVQDPTTEVRSTFQQSPVTARPRRGVVLHHGATTSADQIISMETTGSRQVSSNRVVKDGRCVKIADDPNYRAWSLSDAHWDSVLSSVECANESTNGWTISDASHETLARMVAFWAQRDRFTPHREGPRSGWTVFGHREIYEEFGDSYATACPGGMDLDRIAKRARALLAGASPATLIGAVPIATPQEDTMMIARRQATGEVGIFGSSFATANSSVRGRHIFATQAEYDGFKAVCDMNRAAGIDTAPSLPAFKDIQAKFTVDEVGWKIICNVHGV
jgi:hypothetical protein